MKGTHSVRRLRTSAIALTLATVLLAGCGGQAGKGPAAPAPSQPQGATTPPKLEKTSLKLGLSVQDSGYLPVYIAAEKGLWQQEGLNVELVNFSGGSQHVQAMAAGAIDIGSGAATEPLDGLTSGRHFKAFWGESNYPVYIWYAKPSIKSIADLKGKGRIAISKTGSLTHQLSRWVVKQAGLDPDKDVQYIQAGSPLQRMAALKAGQVDVIPATPPGTFSLERDGFKPLIQLKDYQPEFQYEVFYTKDEFLKANPETVRAFMRGWIKATLWARQNPQEAAKILAKYIGAKDQDMPDLDKTVQFMLPYFFTDGHFATASFDMLAGFYKESGDLEQVPDHSAYLDTSVIDYFKAHPVQ